MINKEKEYNCCFCVDSGHIRISKLLCFHTTRAMMMSESVGGDLFHRVEEERHEECAKHHLLFLTQVNVSRFGRNYSYKKTDQAVKCDNVPS